MKHAFISPINYLHLIPKESKFHLLLAHLMTNEKYCEFYRERKKEGDFIIIDNGAFEFKKPLEPAKYYELVQQSGIVPDIIVAPDYPNEPWEKTLKAGEHFAATYHQYFDKRRTKLMFVPQSIEGDYKGWLKCHDELCVIDEIAFIGISILGVPNAWKELTGTDDITFNRVFCTEYMKKNYIPFPNVKYHYLGCSDPRELLMMQIQGLAYSNDSSTAIWHGINGIQFDNSSRGLKDGKIKKEVDFLLPFDKSTVDAINFNISWISQILGEK